MPYTAKVIEHSISPQNITLATIEAYYPKFIHGEMLTHRVFTRNASSSRAIPVHRLVQAVEKDPAMPVFWGKHQGGMQAHEELTGRELKDAKKTWLEGRDNAVRTALVLFGLGAHK